MTKISFGFADVCLEVTLCCRNSKSNDGEETKIGPKRITKVDCLDALVHVYLPDCTHI